MAVIKESSIDVGGNGDDTPCCATPSVFMDNRGCKVCRNCGMVLGVAHVSEDRGFKSDRAKLSMTSSTGERRHDEIMRHDYPPTTMWLPSFFSPSNRRSPETRMQWVRWAHYIYNNDMRGSKLMAGAFATITSRIPVPPHVWNLAIDIYHRAMAAGMTRTRSCHVVALSSLVIAARVHGMPMSLREAGIVARRDHACLQAIRTRILPAMHVVVHAVPLAVLVHRRAAELGLTPAIESSIVVAVRERGKLAVTPLIDARIAAAMYQAIGSRYTQDEIARCCHVSMVTLRKVWQQMFPKIETRVA